MVAVVAAAAAGERLRRHIALANTIWGDYAAARGMTLVPGHAGWLGTRMPLLAGTVDDVSTAVEMANEAYEASFGGRAFARPLAPLSGHVEAHRVGVLGAIGRFLGIKELKSGDEAFDREFVVKGTSESTAHTLLSPLVREGLLALGAQHFAYDDGSEHGQAPTLLVHIPLMPHDLAGMDRVFQLIALVARVRETESPYR